MADTAVATAPSATPAQASPKKTKSTKKPRAKQVHPRTSEMVSNAIKSLKERGGSSLQAIKKYIAANYKVDCEKLAPFIKKYLKAAVASGELVQTKGKGASGSFKLSSTGAPEKAVVPAPPAPSRVRGSSTSAAKLKKKQQQAKAKSPKKAPEKRKQAPAPKPKKSPSKAKRATKVPTKKPKAPRPKTAAKTKAPKKGSPKKK
ncbi:histone H1B-like [Zootermopsis nevadensis]|uniref:Histone H1.2 n=1 Tax=Zootermopsis nevadensis TaxID=136037 RepID=A0A067QK53_ZOONE|nr:histone H1B-like [Zootermopsis nevadensis]KDR09289.1 Histone H1.2 [Zootermopsis nevadensis]